MPCIELNDKEIRSLALDFRDEALHIERIVELRSCPKQAMHNADHMLNTCATAKFSLNILSCISDFSDIKPLLRLKIPFSKRPSTDKDLRFDRDSTK